MEALFLLSNVPSLTDLSQKKSEIVKKIQVILDLLLKARLKDEALNQIILLTECIRIWFCLKEHKIEEKELSPRVPTVQEYYKTIARIFRPFIYLLCIILWGRKSKLALGVCVLLDLVSDVRAWEAYVLRYPVFDNIILRLTPNFLREIVKAYQSHITYII